MGGLQFFPGSEGLASEMLVLHLGQPSKPICTLIIPDVASNNQPVTKKKVGSKQLRAVVPNGSATTGS